eukprot:Rhum_TRINITY_DN25470_c0_g1::Rhum_TRINITY_DN25470_c0_g1_i1::g.182186::m.182186/K09571/FKBP4_5; FK506-binding protein 4/5
MSGEPLMAGTSAAQVGLTKALGFKEAGNALLKDGSFKQASFQYKQGLMHLKANLPSSGGEGDGMVSMFAAGRKAVVTEEETAAVCALAVVLNSNLAQARIKLSDWDGAIRFADEALALDDKATKAYFRRGVAYLNKDDCERARADFARVARDDPSLVKGQMELLVRKEAAQAKAQENMYKKMFAA